MAASNIDINSGNQFGSQVIAYLNALRKVNEDGPKILAAIIYMVDGNGTDPTHFAELVGKGIYPSNEDAIASYNELASINAKLTQDSAQTNIDAAIKQVCSKHGVI